jgi:hypothetical protein
VKFVSSAYVSRLTLAEAALMMRAAVKDKSYRATPLGVLVGRYIRWFRNEWGATASTIRDYEAILARMSLTLADKDPLEVTVDDLRDVIDQHVGERTSPPAGSACPECGADRRDLPAPVAGCTTCANRFWRRRQRAAA